VNPGPRDVVMVSMIWLGLLVVAYQGWWKPVRDFIQGKTQ
jgi:hypothetical protein